MFTPVTRRRFIAITPLMGIAGMTALAACSPKETEKAITAPAATGPAQAPPAVTPSAPSAASTSWPLLDEQDPQARTLGYVADARRVDKVKFSNYAPGNQCSNCANFLGAADDKTAGCKIFPEKRVAAQGWCAAWVKPA